VKAAQALAQWLTGVQSGQSALAAAQRKLAEHVANPPTSADAADHRDWRATRLKLEGDVEDERAALAIAEQKAAEQKALADEEAIDAQAKVAERAALEAAQLAPVIDAKARSLAADLTRLAELNASVDTYNKIRGTRPFIVDGEKRVREIPAKDFPTEYREVEVYRNEHGHTPSQFREVNGELVPADHGNYTKRRERVVSRNAYSRPAEIPGGRFASAMKLIGLKGEALFPSR
jgi:hypothetical protein